MKELGIRVRDIHRRLFRVTTSNTACINPIRNRKRATSATVTYFRRLGIIILSQSDAIMYRHMHAWVTLDSNYRTPEYCVEIFHL